METQNAKANQNGAALQDVPKERPTNSKGAHSQVRRDSESPRKDSGSSKERTRKRSRSSTSDSSSSSSSESESEHDATLSPEYRSPEPDQVEESELSSSPSPKKKVKKSLKHKKGKKSKKKRRRHKDDGRFKVVKNKAATKFSISKSLSRYVNTTALDFQNETDLKDNIMKDNPVADTILKTPELDDWLEPLLKKRGQTRAIAVDKQLKRIDNKI